MKRTMLLAALALLLVLLTGATSAPVPYNYRLQWFTPLTGGGGGAASSDNYAINFTIGQSAGGTAASTLYEACLGYWCGGRTVEYGTYLPLTLRTY